jgi:hypothetical protein
MQVAFVDAGGLQVFLFDIMSLGEHVGALADFLQNHTFAKFMYNAQLAATVFAHKFGINLAGLFDVGVAIATLEYGAKTSSLFEYFEWAGMPMSGAKQEATRMERNPELWAHRPLAKGTIDYAVKNICTLHASYQILSTRLTNFVGPNSINQVMEQSVQMVQVHAAGGFSCRKAGLWIGEQNPQQERDDHELDDWLAKRFGKSAPARKASPERPVPVVDLPVDAVRAEDSPRTASWRAAVAALAAPPRPPLGSRQRSSSPSLESWLARRSQARADGSPEPKSRRATSAPARKPAAAEKNDMYGPFDGAQFRELIGDKDQRDWAEIWEDEQAGEAQDEEELFDELNAVDRRRLEQAENATRPA